MNTIRNISALFSSQFVSRRPQVSDPVKAHNQTVKSSSVTDKVTISSEARDLASIDNEMKKKVVYDYTQWPLAVAMAESFKGEIGKITSIAKERARQKGQVRECERTALNLKRPQPVEQPLPSRRPKKLGPGYDHFEKRATDAYKKQQKPEPERGKNINTSSLLWYEIAASFLGAFVYALYLDFDFIESIFLALLGSALGIYFHEMHHFVTARRLILEKKLHTYLPHGLGLFHQELIRAMKGESSDSYITVSIDKRGIKVIYPREILSEEENLKVDRSGSRSNVRVLISFGILGIFFHLLFSVIAFSSFIQGGFSTCREGMRKK